MTESGRFEDCLSLNLSFSSSFIGFLLCFATLIATMTTAQEPLASMTKSVNDFTLDLYLATAEGKEGSNVLVSPLSAALATLMVHAGAKGVTADEISRGLHLPSDKTTLESGIKALHDILSNTPNVTLEVANKIFLEKSKTLAPKYQEIVTSVHKSDVKLADFIKESEKERVNINNWVSKKTHDKIKDLLPAGSVKSDTRLVLVNALYFFGKWKHEFDRSDTSDEDFHVSKTKAVKVPMMHQTKNMRYAEIPELDAKAVELCYVNEQVCLQIILPNAKDGLEALHSKLRTRSFDLSNIEFYSTKVQLSLPKFKMEETINLKDIYQKMGIREMFSSKADLTGMIEGNEPLAVSEAIQKTFIEVNEQGTEAAAATACLGRRKRCVEMPVELSVDHPFLLRLLYLTSVIFIGSHYEPTILSSEENVANESDASCFNDDPQTSDDTHPHKPSHCEL